jgi:hypothetical protein
MSGPEEERDLRRYVRYVPTEETLERQWRAISERLDAVAPRRRGRRTASGLRMAAVPEEEVMPAPEPPEGHEPDDG